MANRLLDEFNSGTKYGTPEWEYETKQGVYQSLKGAEDAPFVATGIARGIGAAAYQATSIMANLGSMIPGGPMSWNNYRISGKASDLIRPYFGNSPTSRQMRAAYEGFDEAFDSGSFSEFSKGSGEILAMLWPVLKAGSLITKGFIHMAPIFTEKAGELAAKNAPKFAQALKEMGAAIPVRRAAEIAGDRLGPAPMFERMIMAAGMATGFGSYDFVREHAETGDFELSLKAGALSGALAMGMEATGVAAFRTLFPKHASTVDIKGMHKVWEEASPKVREAILSGDKKAIQDLGKVTILNKNKGYVDKASAALNKLIDMEGVNYPKVFTDYAGKATLDQNVAWYRQIGEQFKGYDDVVGFEKLAGKMGAYPKETKDWLVGLGAERGPLDKATRRFNLKKGAIQKTEAQFKTAISDIGSIEQMLANTSSGRRAIMSTPMNSARLLKEARENTARWEARLVAEKMSNSAELSTYYNLAKARVKKGYAGAMDGTIGMWKLNYLSSPGGMATQMGPASVRFMEAMEMVAVKTNPRIAKAFGMIDDMNETLTPLLETWSNSFKPPHAPLRKFTTKDNAHLVELQHTYEKGLMPAVREKYGEAIAKEWEKGAVDLVETVGKEMDDIGFMTKRTREEMISQGTPGHMPHVMDDMAGDFTKLEGAITDSLKARGMSQQNITAFINSLEHKQKGIGHFGTIDHQRLVPGTAWEKINGSYRGGGSLKSAPPLPLVKDPINALKLHMDASIHRIELAKVAGNEGELAGFWKALMVKTGADETAANWLVDTMFFNNVVDHSMSKLYRNIQASQVLSKLSWVTLANFFQPNMTATRFNARRAGIGLAKGAGDVAAGTKWTKYWESLDNFTKSLGSSDKPIIAGMVGIMEKSMLASAEIYKGARARTALEGLAE